jgi:GDP-L-fucose synthase
MKILVTGGTGMVGSAFRNIETDNELILVGSSDYDLRDICQVENMFCENKFEAVIHLAAKVGGVKGNSDFVSDFFYENILINTNVLNIAKNKKIKKVVSLLSTCVYPDGISLPLIEDKIHNGEPHESNFGYAYAKRMLDVQSRAIRKQYGLNYVTAVPNNIYGENDNFDLENGHVIPAIIRKIYEAKNSGNTPTFWGSGRPLREFTYSEDIARALINICEEYNETQPVNIGRTGEVSIWTVVRNICKFLEYEGEVFWDKDKPEGQYRKPSDNKKFKEIFPNFKYTNLDIGLEKTCKWFTKTYPNVRGV